jgi:hypothetical protein
MNITQEAFEKRRGHFSIKEFCITGERPPLEVAESIILNHIDVLNPIREELGAPIIISQKAGYRPKEYELSKGRSGKSQHTFERVDETTGEVIVTGGAVDLTSRNLDELGSLIRASGKYTRMCYYPNNGFYHCDHKPTANGVRQYFECDSPAGRWVFKGNM